MIFDELVDAPIWRLSKQRSWEWVDLAECSESIESMGFNVNDRRFQRLLNAEDFTGPKERRRCRFGRSSQWAWLNAEFFRMARAEAVGDVDDYGFIYNQIQFHLAVARLFSILQYPGKDHVETGVFYVFCELISRFLTRWHSRILMNCRSNIEIVREVNLLKERGLSVYGHTVAKNGALRSIAGQPFAPGARSDSFDRHSRILEMTRLIEDYVERWQPGSCAPS